MLEHDTAQTLDRLTQVSVQGEQGFSTCAKEAADPELAALLRACARQCHDAAHELRELTRALGGDAALSVHAPNDALQRSRHGWGALSAEMPRRDDRAVLAQCEHAEAVARTVYGDALAHALPANVYRLVAAQYQGVLTTCQRLNARRQELLRR